MALPSAGHSGRDADQIRSMRPEVLRPGHREPGSRVLKPGHREARCEVARPVVRIRKAGEGVEGPRRRGVRVAGAVPEIEAAWARKFGEDVPFGELTHVRPASGLEASTGKGKGEPTRLHRPLPVDGSPAEYSHRAVGLGFNAVPFQAYEYTQAFETDADAATWAWRKYGDTPNLLRDLEQLGATFARQPKLIDLTWPNSVDIPVIEGADLTPLKDALRSTGVYDQLVEFFVTSFTRSDRQAPPIQLVFTWLTVLGVAPMVDPIGELHPDAAVPLSWADAHITADVKRRLPEVLWWDGRTYTLPDCFSVRTGESVTLTPADAPWATGTLDARSPYKLYYVYLLGRAVGELLLEVDADVRAAVGEKTGLSVLDHIAGIELCNEVNIKNVVLGDDGLPSATESARLWMRVVREGIRGLREALGDTRVNLWLPSLWSYSLPDDEADASVGAQLSTFRYTLAFDAALLTWISVWDTIVDADACDSGGDAWPTVDRSWIANQDYHWYHYKGTGAPVIQLVAEAEALRGLFQTTGLEAVVGDDVTLSVCETGTSVYKADVITDDYPYWNALLLPDGVRVESVDPNAYPFQAAEVWRRLATALCVAGHVSWHTHMSSTNGGNLPFLPGNGADVDENAFRDMGVRDDFHCDTKQTTTAALGRQRPAWWAFQRLAAVLGARTHEDRAEWRGRLLTRPADPGNDYQGLSSDERATFRSDRESMVVALGFYLGEAGAALGMRFAYVLFLDPATRYDVTSESRPSVSIHVANRSRGRTLRYRSVPDGPLVRASGLELQFPGDEPPWHGRWPWDILREGPASAASTGSVEVAVGDPPVVVTAEGELVFSW